MLFTKFSRRSRSRRAAGRAMVSSGVRTAPVCASRTLPGMCQWTGMARGSAQPHDTFHEEELWSRREALPQGCEFKKQMSLSSGNEKVIFVKFSVMSCEELVGRDLVDTVQCAKEDPLQLPLLLLRHRVHQHSGSSVSSSLPSASFLR